jgi:hypothetical protein
MTRLPFFEKQWSRGGALSFCQEYELILLGVRQAVVPGGETGLQPVGRLSARSRDDPKIVSVARRLVISQRCIHLWN